MTQNIFHIVAFHQKICDGYSIAGEILQSHELLSRIQDVVKLTYTKLPPSTLWNRLAFQQDMWRKSQLKEIEVREYYYKNPEVIATTYKNTPGIFVNINGVKSKSVETFIGNAAHEFGHIPLGYSHGSNWPPGSKVGWLLGDREDKNLSVPHTLSRLVVEIAKDRKLI